MSLYEYPHTNLNQPNLDYVCRKIGDIDRTADAVESAKTAAVSAKNDAENAATAAHLSKTAAENSATSAEGAKTAAETAATSANAAAESANNTKTQIVNKLEQFDDEHDIIMQDTSAWIINENTDKLLKLPTTGTVLDYSLKDASHSSTITDTTEPDILMKFTDYLKCKDYLIIDNHKAGTIFYIYFYNLENGEYVPNWDIIKENSNSGQRNRITTGNHYEVINLPENCYVKIGVVSGNPAIYTWNGEMVGIDISADIFRITTTGATQISSDDNQYTAFLPANTKFIFGINQGFRPILGLKADGSTELVYQTPTIYAYEFTYNPDYVGYYISLRSKTDDDDNSVDFKSDQRGTFYCIAEFDWGEKCSNYSKHIADNAKKVNDFKWKPQKNMLLNQLGLNNRQYYHNNHWYHGIPYSSYWTKPHFVGWHISPHTFANAVNDINSVLYNEDVPTGTNTAAPYYGTVCSAYVSMIAGFPCINTNAGFLYSPDIENRLAFNPELGTIMSAGNHCFVPIEKKWNNEFGSISIAESLHPLSNITIRYDNVNNELSTVYGHNNGDSYFDGYFFTAVHKKQNCKLSNVPYGDFDDVELVNGSARPYYGDKCVYTSAMDAVKINLHGDNINTLYIVTPDEDVISTSTAGATVIDIKSLLTVDGIYEVYTNIDATRESFEYITVEPITVTLTDESVSFSDNDFWYANCKVSGHELLDRGSEQACVEMHTNNDYSGWFRNNQKIDSVRAVFCKGVYGAYLRPIDE